MRIVRSKAQEHWQGRLTRLADFSKRRRPPNRLVGVLLNRVQKLRDGRCGRLAELSERKCRTVAQIFIVRIDDVANWLWVVKFSTDSRQAKNGRRSNLVVRVFGHHDRL